MKKFSFAFLVLLLSSCGMDLTNKKFREEKTTRIEAQKNLHAEQTENQLLAEMLKNVAVTNSFYWAFVNSHLGYPIDTYDAAERICKKIGFELPTATMLNDEAVSIPGIKQMSFDEQNIDRSVFIRESSKEQGFRYLVCAKQK